MATQQKEHATSEVETGRLEAFSDGVFAVAITLLVFDLQSPAARDLAARHQSLQRALLDQWPSYLAYALSFTTILIMWVNHHTMFKCVKRTDHLFLLLNGLLLLCVTVIPFPTKLLADYIQQPDARVAAVVYSGTFLVAACMFNILWRYAAHRDRLLGEHVDRRLVQSITTAYRFGPLTYAVAFLVAFVSAGMSVAIGIALAIYFALPHRAVTASSP